MKINNSNRIIQKSDFLEEIKFKIDEAGEVLTQLVAGQYKRPIDAFVRELGTNAYEAHQAVGKENIPFEVRLPTVADPRWIIRDFGSGLSHESIKTLYTSIGSSTKKDSNEFGGCFGLGSKSPLSYTNTFSVNSYFDGKVSSYLVYYDENLSPHFDLISVEETDKPCGLEISIPIKKADISEVAIVSKKLYQRFNTLPILKLGSQDILCEKETYSKSIKNFHVYNSLSVKMGNIVYPVDYVIDNINYSNVNLLIELPIGSLDVSTSRESLKYTLKTRTCLKLAIDAGVNLFKSEYQNAINNCSNIFEASNYFYIEIKKFNFLKLSDFRYNDRPLLEHSFTLPCGDIYTLYGSVFSRKTGWNKNTLSINTKAKIYLLDSKKAFKVKIKQDLISNSIFTALVLDPESPKINETLTKLNLTIDDLCKTSQLNYVSPPRKGKKSEYQGYNILKYRGGTAPTQSWEAVTALADIFDKKCYYVELSNYTISLGDRGVSYNTMAEISAFLSVDLYGVRKSGKIPPNWISLSNLLLEKKEFLLKKQSEYLTASTIRQNSCYFLRNIDLVTGDQEIQEFRIAYRGLNLSNYERIAAILQLKPEMDNKLYSSFQNLKKKYPLLDAFSFISHKDEIQFYIKGKK